MTLRNTTPPPQGRKDFAPEAYADFELVEAAKIRELRAHLAPALVAEDFALVDDIAKG